MQERQQQGLPDLEIEQQEYLRTAALAAAARSNFLAYTKYIEPGFLTPKHIQFLAAHLEAIERGDIDRLLITEPPRHGKSYITSGIFPSWYLSRDPNRIVMLVSHSADLAETFSIQNRDIIATNPKYADVFPNVTIKANRRGASVWAVNDARESMIANGIMGGLTGYGASLIIFDDPVKTYEQAQSPTYRDKVFNEYKSSARTRLTPDGRLILIMTRWNEEDLAGMILNSPEAKRWVVLHLPAYSYGVMEDYEEIYPNEVERTQAIAALPKTAFPDPLGRHKGELLWPERWDEKYMTEQKLVLGHQFEALYQGNPSAPEGNSFKRDWFRSITKSMLVKMKAEPRARVRSYDLAFGGSKRSDFTAGTKATLYVLPDLSSIKDPEVADYIKSEKIPRVFVVVEDLFHQRKEWDETSEDLVQQALEDGDKYLLLVEGVAAQNIGWKSLRKDDRLWKHSIKAVTTDRAKDDRNSYAIKLASQGMLFFQYPTVFQPPEWEEDFVNELVGFPNAKNDDIHDSFVQLINYWQPHIDNALKKYGGTDFKSKGKEKPQQLIKNLPQEFVSYKKATRQRDRMGWFQR